MDVLGREGTCNKTVHKNVVSSGSGLDGSVHITRDWMDRVTIGRTTIRQREGNVRVNEC